MREKPTCRRISSVCSSMVFEKKHACYGADLNYGLVVHKKTRVFFFFIRYTKLISKGESNKFLVAIEDEKLLYFVSRGM